MAFLIYEVAAGDNTQLARTEHSFSLAGYNLLYSAWMAQGRPVESGWQVSAAELAAIQFGKGDASVNKRLIVDFDPNSIKRIALIELLHVYAYTYGVEGDNSATWSPLMLRFRDVLYQDDLGEKWGAERILRNKQVVNRPTTEGDILEFLYLHGDAGGWRWGMNGMTNAAFLHKQARDYFRQFF